MEGWWLFWLCVGPLIVAVRHIVWNNPFYVFYNTIDCLLLTPRNQLVEAASEQQLLRFGVLFPLGAMDV